ncbi:cytochrome c family protein [Roseomonas terrae]|jgi:cytochrome c|uniref:Cytochrome c family protein n=1 Tax=Neoroseomonas terrae TaxID=424799 RepID=A0ABS5ELR1_9PROT|nr:cytochrome c family protein [Neoroseomonas terrae]MBR0651963.1 cytochrome c family protein [Neoroseomonas terrae]
MRRIVMAMTLAAMPGMAVAQQGDAAAGQRVYNQCRACHTVDQGGRNGVGPNLFGIVGRRAGSVEGFRYSANLRELGAEDLTWTEDRLRAYVANPKAVVPRGSMSYAGLRNETMINDLMAYLTSLR